MYMYLLGQIALMVHIHALIGLRPFVQKCCPAPMNKSRGRSCQDEEVNKELDSSNATIQCCVHWLFLACRSVIFNSTYTFTVGRNRIVCA